MSQTPKPLADKVALVTGASRGIGKTIALRLAMEGAYVFGTARTEAGVNSFLQSLEDANLKGSGQGLILDIANKDSITQALDTISEIKSMPSILINNAGITKDNLALRMKDEEWTEVIETNLTGTYRLTQQCLRAMLKARYGRIVNITSVVGLIGNAGQANYAAAKAGLIGLTKSLARELGSRGITVNAIAPGFIETDMTDNLTEAQRAHLLEQIPLGRIGKPEEIAYAVSFLVSDMASYITGETMHVNGGMLMA